MVSYLGEFFLPVIYYSYSGPNTFSLSSIHTEVQVISFVGYTGVEGGRPPLWNLQNLCPVPPYAFT